MTGRCVQPIPVSRYTSHALDLALEDLQATQIVAVDVIQLSSQCLGGLCDYCAGTVASGPAHLLESHAVSGVRDQGGQALLARCLALSAGDVECGHLAVGGW